MTKSQPGTVGVFLAYYAGSRVFADAAANANDSTVSMMLASSIGSRPWSLASKSISMRPFRQTMNDFRSVRALGHPRLESVETAGRDPEAEGASRIREKEREVNAVALSLEVLGLNECKWVCFWRAACACHKNVGEFLLDAGVAAAAQTPADRRQFVLSETQWQAFQEALDRPVQSKPRLKELLREPGVLG